MNRLSYVAATAVLSILLPAVSSATVIVDGVGGGGKYASLQEGIDAALASPSETTVEIQANTLPTGASITPATTLARALTIQAGAGFNPVIGGPVEINPANQDQLVTLSGLTITAEALAMLSVGATLTANNCVFAPAGAATEVRVGITAGTDCPGTLGVLTLNDCVIKGFYGLYVGRSIKDYVINRCTFVSVDPSVRVQEYGVIHGGNNPMTPGGPANDEPINAPAPALARTLTITSSQITAAKPLGWPPCCAAGWVDENTIGAVTATNTIFQTPAALADGARLTFLGSYPNVPQGGPYTHTFTHCTFRSTQLNTYASNSEQMNVVFNDNLFDNPVTYIGTIVAVTNPASISLSGNANAWNLPVTNATYGRPAGTNENLTAMQFVSPDYPKVPIGTEYIRTAVDATDFITTNGLLLSSGFAIAANKAVAVVPAVSTDFQGQTRPQGGSSNDLGADEVDETAAVSYWTLY